MPEEERAGIQPRPAIATTPPVQHGAIDYAELEQLGLAPADVLDFSVNSNPYGPAPLVRAALADVPLDRYPDREALALRRALAAHLGLSVEQIVVGNGTAELLWLAAVAFLQSGDRVLIVGPTFGEYARVAALQGASVHEWTARPTDDFAVDVIAVARQIDILTPRLVFVCNPNNPTGALLPSEAIGAWAAAHPHTLFIVDEAYLAFAPQGTARSVLPLALEAPGPALETLGQAAANVLVIRSMTKDYALAGLRLGYAAGPAGLVTTLTQVRPAWNVNALAQAAGLAALADQAHLSTSLAALADAKADLVRGLTTLGLAPTPSATHFFLVLVGDGAAFRRDLLRHGLLVRDCASFGLPAYVRIAAHRPEENARLLDTIRRLEHP